MRKFLFTTAIILLVVALTGCSTATSSGSSKPKILRTAELGGKYQMYQLEITLTSGEQFPIILQLNNGDKVDGYYYLESGDRNIAFQVTAASPIYISDLKNLGTDETVSDRFSFTASQAQGTGYTLTLSNTSDKTAKTKSTIFMELIYPGTAPLFSPLTQ